MCVHGWMGFERNNSVYIFIYIYIWLWLQYSGQLDMVCVCICVCHHAMCWRCGIQRFGARFPHPLRWLVLMLSLYNICVSIYYYMVAYVFHLSPLYGNGSTECCCATLHCECILQRASTATVVSRWSLFLGMRLTVCALVRVFVRTWSTEIVEGGRGWGRWVNLCSLCVLDRLLACI